MRDITIRIIGGSLLFTVASYVSAETLSPDPAWKQGVLANGLQWQILATPQRPTDRTEIRLSIRSGSLSETNQQLGYSHFLPRLALTQSVSLPAAQAKILWQQAIDADNPIPPAITSYNVTSYNLSLPNNRPDLLKDALIWLADAATHLHITSQTIDNALQTADMVASWPQNTRDNWWRYRLTGSNLLASNPNAEPVTPPDSQSLSDFYQKWYTPDVMTLVIVGNVDARALSEQVIKTFGSLQGKRATPAPLPMLAALPATPISIATRQVTQDTLAMMWDQPWQPIRDSAALLQYWQTDLAREAAFQYVQAKLAESPAGKAAALTFDCRVLFQRGQCGMSLSAAGDKLNAELDRLARLLAALRDNGLNKTEFTRLIDLQQQQLQKLFTTYAHTNTRTLIDQRMRSLQDKVVNIAPEQYQKLRQQFLAALSLEQLNQSLHQLLSTPPALVLFQPENEAEYDVQQLQQSWNAIMYPALAEKNGADKAEQPPAATTPASAIPESAVPESAVPESAVPELASPKSAIPQSAIPQSTSPQSASPDSTTPASPGGE